MADETRDVLIKVDVDRKGADTGLGAIEDKSKKASKGLDKTKKSADEASKSVTSMAKDTKVFGISINSLSAGFQAMRGGIGKAVTSLKVFKIALAATGIGLLVIAIGSLITFLTRTQEGMDIVTKAMAQVGAVVDVLLDRFAKLGQVFKALGDAAVKFFRGDMVGAMESAKEAGENLADAFAGIGAEIKKDVILAGELADKFAVLEKQEIANIVIQAERRRDIAKRLLITKDETKSAQERLKAAKEASDLEQAILDEAFKQQTDRVAFEQLEFDRALSVNKDERALNEEKAKLFQLEEASAKKQRAIALEIAKFQRLVIKERTEAAEIVLEIQAEEERRKNVAFEKTIERQGLEIEAIQNTSLKKIEINRITLDTINEDQEKQDDKRLDQIEVLADREKEIARRKRDALIGFVQQGLDSQKSLGKIALLLRKGVAIKEIFISTKEAIVKATADVPFPLSLLVGAFYGAFGAAQAAAVAGVQFAGGGRVKGRRGTPRFGDKVHIRANPGEVYLNQSQQTKLGGARTFKAIGVPGFQDGGVVPGARFDSTLIEENFNISDALSKVKIVATVEDINREQERVEVVENRAVI